VNSIRELIRRWADTLLTRDLPGHMSLYAPTLDRFNGSSHVARESVRASKERVLPGFAGVRRFEIYDFRLLPSGDGSSIAEFRIESDAAARRVIGWYRLQLRQIDGQWKIYGEEKLESVSRRGGH
jgi:ketosteroid isomerase-like protein